MRLDFDLARELLLEIESAQSDDEWILSVCNIGESYSRYYTLKKLDEAGYITCSYQPGYGEVKGEDWINVEELTFSGHQFLDTIRDPAIWKATKATAQTVGGVTFRMLGEIGTALAKAKLKEWTGIDIP